MDNLACNNKTQPVLRKVKKKQGKDEMDRLKQAEKKKRRLEKALATSAAIRSELEKKKEKKKEEQQRLDEEGAATAEAVALHVLLGEDSEESHKIVLNKYESAAPWNCSAHADFLMGGRRASQPYQNIPKCALDRIGWISDTHVSLLRRGGLEGSGWSCPSGIYGRDVHGPYIEGRGWPTSELSPGILAAQAVSSLQIREDAHVDNFFLDGMLRG